MIMLNYAGGLRLSELLSLQVAHVNEMKESIVVLRKGGDYQEIPVGGLAMEYLVTYVAEFRGAMEPTGDHVFCTLQGGPLGIGAYGHLFKKYAQTLALGHYTSHSLRHAAATHMMRNGADLRGVQQFLGHKHIESTEIYTRVEPLDIRKAIDRMAF